VVVIIGPKNITINNIIIIKVGWEVALVIMESKEGLEGWVMVLKGGLAMEGQAGIKVEMELEDLGAQAVVGWEDSMEDLVTGWEEGLEGDRSVKIFGFFVAEILNSCYNMNMAMI
jgi:hypothetical protein